MSAWYKYALGYVLGIISSVVAHRVRINRTCKCDELLIKETKEAYEYDKASYRSISNQYRISSDKFDKTDLRKNFYEKSNTEEILPQDSSETSLSLVNEVEMSDDELPEDLVLTAEPAEGGIYKWMSPTEYQLAKAEGKTVQELEYSISEDTFYSMTVVNFKTERKIVSHKAVRSWIGTGLYKFFLDEVNRNATQTVFCAYNDSLDLSVLIEAYD